MKPVTKTSLEVLHDSNFDRRSSGEMRFYFLQLDVACLVNMTVAPALL